jgi:hypothetical protein
MLCAEHCLSSTHISTIIGALPICVKNGEPLCLRIAGLWIRIHFTNTDPDPIRIQGFNDQKLGKKLQLKIFLNFFFLSKTAIYLFLGLQKVCPSYRRSLQFSKEAIQHFKTWTFTNYCLLLWVIYALLDPDPDSEYGSGSGSTDPIEYGSNPDPDPQPCRIGTLLQKILN